MQLASCTCSIPTPPNKINLYWSNGFSSQRYACFLLRDTWKATGSLYYKLWVGLNRFKPNTDF